MRHNVFSMLAAFAVMLGSCTSEVEEITPTNPDEGQTMHTATLVFDGGIDHFDPQTRAVTSDWDDGATIYIQYTTTRGTEIGRATYSQSKGEWTVNYGDIRSGEQGKCEVRFFENPKAVSWPTSITLSEQSAVFADTDASFSLENGLMKITAHLKPLTGRLRFKGEAGQKVTFDGVKWYTGFNIASNTLSTGSSSMTLTVASDGYTPYVYAVFSNSSSPQLNVESGNEDYTFQKSFDSSVLAAGKSGYLNIPTMDMYNGWKMVTAPADPLGLCKNNKHPHKIDMGNGLKWSCCNVGARTPVEYGDYFAWGETQTKTTYNWSTYSLCNGSNSIMTKYCNSSSYGTVDNKTKLDLTDDAARVNWGGTWRMPTIDEYSTLNSSCTWTWTTVGGVNGYKVTAKNGNVLFFPAAGFRYDSSLINAGSRGHYWSSSLYKSNANLARGLYISSSDHYTDYNDNRCSGLSVRPVTE